MPPAVVCALAIVSTIGAAFVFKQFVYDPHLSHVVRRWTEQWRRRRADIQHGDDDDDVPMDERARSSRVRSDDTAVSSSWERTGTRPADGLLSRSRLRPMLQEEKSSIELDNLIAHALGERSHGRATLSPQDLRQRTAANRVSRQGGHHPLELEEDANPLPKYVPLSPRRMHVVCNSGSASPATPSFDNDLNGLPSESASLTTTSTALHTLSSPPQIAIAPPLIGSPSLSGSMIGSQDPLLHNQVGEIRVSPNMDRELETLASSPSQISALSHDVLLPPSTAPLSHSRISSPARSQEQEQNSPSPFLLRVPSVPSLSQSYPQELEVEHGLELLSAPSSRPDSPYSMANISPHPSALAHENLDGVLRHPFGSPPSDVFSSATPLEMGLGNESFATLSPAVGPRQLALRAAGGSGSGMYPMSLVASGSFESTAQEHPSDMSTPLSMTSSSESNTYHSFSELESGNEDDDDVPLSARRASLILNMSADSNSPRKTTAREDLGHGQGLGLTFGPPSPGNPPAPLNPSILSPRSRLAEVSTTGDGAHFRPPIGPPSDTSELSDLDFMSDYSASSELGEVVSYPGSVNGSKDSESGGGGIGSHPRPTNGSSDRESDASWSIAGGSEFGDDAPQPPTPQLRPIRELKRDDTIRLRKKL